MFDDWCKYYKPEREGEVEVTGRWDCEWTWEKSVEYGEEEWVAVGYVGWLYFGY